MLTPMDLTNTKLYPDYKLRAMVAICRGFWKHQATPEEIQNAKLAKRELKRRKEESEK